MKTILIVAHNADLRFNLSSILKDEGYNTIGVGDGRRVLRVVKKNPPSLVLLDIKLPRINWMKLLEGIKRIEKDVVIIILSGRGDGSDAERAMKLGAFDHISEPFDNGALIPAVRRALDTRYSSRFTNGAENLSKRLGERTANIEEAMGESPQIKQVLRQVEIIAPTNMTVILQGESGTGKELIARMIHRESLRKDKPLIAINCGAIPETLVESELFGYEKGAFTGADAKKEGKFEQANEGTMFLDEIGNLPDAAQAKLLRVIEERRLQHLGGRQNIRIDVRIIVATKDKLSESAREGKFRDDLFYRLNEFHIDLPPLRERKGDIPTLVKCFLGEANWELNKKVQGVSKEAMKFLLGYHWPGNGRELRNVIKRAILLAESRHILPDHLPADIVNGSQNVFRKTLARLGDLTEQVNLLRGTKTLDESASLKDALRKVETELIKKAIEEAGGNKVKASKILRINRKGLYRRMKSLGV